MEIKKLEYKNIIGILNKKRKEMLFLSFIELCHASVT